ncbi:MAG: hypothetical protein MUF57_07070, partial [Gammaproteobacteria bacterium]|nr:hypothetical protein [Gammaproteobacteria bacterium]
MPKPTQAQLRRPARRVGNEDEPAEHDDLADHYERDVDAARAPRGGVTPLDHQQVRGEAHQRVGGEECRGVLRENHPEVAGHRQQEAAARPARLQPAPAEGIEGCRQPDQCGWEQEDPASLVQSEARAVEQVVERDRCPGGQRKGRHDRRRDRGEGQRAGRTGPRQRERGREQRRRRDEQQPEPGERRAHGPYSRPVTSSAQRSGLNGAAANSPAASA